MSSGHNLCRAPAVGFSSPGHQPSTDGLEMVVYGVVTLALMAHIRYSLGFRYLLCLASSAKMSSVPLVEVSRFRLYLLALCDSVRSDSHCQNSFPIRPDRASEPRKRLQQRRSRPITRHREFQGIFGIAQETGSSRCIECTHVPQKPLSQRCCSV
jgi:hypothetical protein